MLDRILNGFRPYSSNSTTTNEYVDCFQCRMIGGGGLVGLGGYVIFYSFRKRNSPNVNKLTIFASAFIGSVVMTLGALRMLGVHELQHRIRQQQHQQKNIGQDSLTSNNQKTNPELLKD